MADKARSDKARSDKARPDENVNGAEALTYEQARDELAGVVAALEAGGLTLEESLALWERGEVLAAHCQAWLDAARERVDGPDMGEDESDDEDEDEDEDDD